jgi:hypothetical protein
MARAKANPDPAVEDHTAGGRTFRIQAWRSGAYVIFEGDVLVHSNPARVGSGFGAPRYPSNRLQAEAIATAKNWIEVFGVRPV